MGKKSRHYCITSYDIGKVPCPEQHKWVRYLIYQGEICPQTKKKHFQAYVEANKPVSWKRCKELFDEKCHVEIRRGTRDQARDYCRDRSKETFTDVVEYGCWGAGGQGARNDIAQAVEIVKTTPKSCMQKLAETVPIQYVKYSRGLKELAFVLHRGPEWRDIRAEVCWGPAGMGKSRYYRNECKKEGLTYFSLDTDKGLWFDGYDGEDVLIIDDPDFTHLSQAWLKKLTDGHRLRLPIKGGHTWAQWTWVFITSEVNPQSWYKELDEGTVRRMKFYRADQLIS